MSRIALVVFIVVVAPVLVADHYIADCPMTLVATSAGTGDFGGSPHAIFRNGNLVYELRGQYLTTYSVNDLGDVQVTRDDFVGGSLGARETTGGVAFSNGYLFVSSEAGMEIFDVRNVRAGGSPPSRLSVTPNLHYRRMAVSGNTLAALYPATDLPCYPAQFSNCFNAVDLFDVSNLGMPIRLSSITTQSGINTFLVGLNDVAFNNGFMVVTGFGGTAVYNVSNPSAPSLVTSTSRAGTFLVSNGTNLLGVGNDDSVLIYTVSATGQLTPYLMETLSKSLTIDRANRIVFHPRGTFDEAGTRLIMMADELNPMTGKPARTIAFDVFDFDTPQFEGNDPRNYETISFVTGDEVKDNPFAVGPYVYVVGETSGLEAWGACDQIAGRIEVDTVNSLFCGTTEIHGWVTGTNRIANVELLLDNGSLGTQSSPGLREPLRTDISARTPVVTWRITANLDATPRGDHVLRAVGTDSLGNRRQFASMKIFFPGPGANCQARRRSALH
jgi:hypothetical protein